MSEGERTFGPFRDDASEGPEVVKPPTHDEMMNEMRCQVDHTRYPDPAHWEAKILWMERGGARGFVTACGEESTEAVRNLYDHFTRMKNEGWKRSE